MSELRGGNGKWGEDDCMMHALVSSAFSNERRNYYAFTLFLTRLLPGATGARVEVMIPGVSNERKEIGMGLKWKHYDPDSCPIAVRQRCSNPLQSFSPDVALHNARRKHFDQ